MKRIDRYIFKTVMGTALVALMALLIMEMLILLLGELEDIGKGGYGVPQMLEYVALSLPRRAYEIAPMALLLGGLLGMGTLASNSELVVMRATGMSLLRLTGSALQAGLVLGLAALVLGEFVVPVAERHAEAGRAAAQGEPVTIREGRGFWARNGNDFINVRAVLPGVQLADIRIYALDNNFDLKSVTWARGARYFDGQWLLEDLNRSTLQAERTTTEHLASAHVNWALNPKLLEVLATDPKDLPMSDLRAYIGYLHNNALDARTYELAFWAKVFAPLTNLTMLFIAMPFAFTPQRSTGTGQRLLIGIFLGLVFYVLNRMLGNTVLLYGYPPLLGALLPNLVFLGAGTYALRRLR